MSSAWQRFWFNPGDTHILGILRAVLVLNAVMLQIIPGLRALPEWARRPEALNHPTGFHAVTGLGWPPDPASIPWITAASLVVGLCACLGIATRWSLAGFLVVYGYLVGGYSTFGIFDHMTVLIFHVLLVLIMAPGATAWSVDAAIAGRRAGTPIYPSLRGADGERWGLQLILILIASTYMIAGIAKLRWGGLSWLDGSTLAWYLSGQSCPDHVPLLADPSAHPQSAWRDGVGLIDHAYMSKQSGIAAWIAAHPPLPMMMAVGGVVFELSAWLLLVRRMRNWILLTGFAFHTMAGELMGHNFWDWKLLCLLLLDWPALARGVHWALLRLWPQPTVGGDTIVFYDGNCGLCDATVSWALAWDGEGRLRFATLQGVEAERVFGPLAGRGGPDSILVTQAGRTLDRSSAVIAICVELGGLWRLAIGLRLLPRPLRDAAYAVVARWRYRIFGRLETCRLPSPAERARFID